MAFCAWVLGRRRGLCEGLPRACVGGRVLPASASVFRQPPDAARRWLSCAATRRGAAPSHGGPHPVSTSEGSGMSQRCLCRRHVPRLGQFVPIPHSASSSSSDRGACSKTAHSANPCHFCCSNGASRRQMAPAAITALTDCEPLQTMLWRTTLLSRAARVCGEMLSRSYNAQVQQQKWRASTDS